MHFTCIHCNWVATTSDGWSNWYTAGQHEEETGHATVDQNRYVRQHGPKLHGIEA